MSELIKIKRDALRTNQRKYQIDKMLYEKRCPNKQYKTQKQKIVHLDQNQILQEDVSQDSFIQIVGEYLYNEKDIIDHGTYSTVYKGVKITDSTFLVAIKKIDLKDQQPIRTENEIEILKKLRSKFVVKLYNAYQIEQSFYLVMELCDGTQIHQYQKNHQAREQIHQVELKALNIFSKFSKEQKYFINIIQSIEILNQKIFQQRRIKYLFNLIWIKIADFGFAKKLEKLSIESMKCGTPFTMAPEVFQADYVYPIKYTNKQDVWSLGVILFQLFYKSHPFNGLVQSLLNNERLIPEQPDKIVDNFIDQTLQPHEKDRLNFQQVLNHPIRKYKPQQEMYEEITQKDYIELDTDNQKTVKNKIFVFFSGFLKKLGSSFN